MIAKHPVQAGVIIVVTKLIVVFFVAGLMRVTVISIMSMAMTALMM